MVAFGNTKTLGYAEAHIIIYAYMTDHLVHGTIPLKHTTWHIILEVDTRDNSRRMIRASWWLISCEVEIAHLNAPLHRNGILSVARGFLVLICYMGPLHVADS